MNEILFEYLIDKTISFDENIKKLLRYRGIKKTGISIKNYEELLELFKKDGIDNFEVTYPVRRGHINKWAKSFASNRLNGNYISPERLEPFVARYVIAINQIGIKTFYSCDGWHQNSENVLLIGFQDRNSMIWHKIITNLFFDKIDIAWIYDFPIGILRLPKEDIQKLKLYDLLNKRAEYFESNREMLLNVKKKLIVKVKGKRKNTLSDEELEKFLLDNIAEYVLVER